MDLQEIRSELNQIDTQAGVALEYIIDNEDELGYSEELEELTEALEQIQYKITNIQEQQGWI